MTGPGGLKSSPALVQHAAGSMVMDIVRGEHRDPARLIVAPAIKPLEQHQAAAHREVRGPLADCQDVVGDPVEHRRKPLARHGPCLGFDHS